MSAASSTMTTATLDRELSRQRLEFARNLAASQLDTDWPYDDARDALKTIKNTLGALIDEIDALDEDAAESLVKQYGLEALSTVSELMGFIGFIVRSSDVRNSFESYAPLNEVGAKLLGNDLRLILGSEWTYNPFTYPIPAAALSEFVLVGLPASEAQNALLLPVAGHELGHALWLKTKTNNLLGPKVFQLTIKKFQENWNTVKNEFPQGVTKDEIEGDLQAREVWSKTNSYALRQCEEVFCDLVGFWIYGEAYIHAFSYILSPDSGTRHSSYYPANRHRAQYLAKVAISWGGEAASKLPEQFAQPDEPKDIFTALAVEITTELINEISDLVEELCQKRDVTRPTKSGMDMAWNSLSKVYPADHRSTAAEVLCAAWKIRRDFKNWHVSGTEDIRKVNILNDLVLKSFEVSEWQALR